MKRKKKEPDTRYIICGDHKKRRWSIVCVHLVTGTSRMWNSVEGSEGDGVMDWLCPECLREFDRIVRARDLTNLRPICVECVKKLRTNYDPGYPPYRSTHCAFGL